MFKIKRFDELFKVSSAKRVLKSQWKKEGVPFYRGREVTKLSMNGSVDNQLFITKTYFEELKQKHGVPNVGDIIMTAIGTIGNAYIVKSNDEFYFKDASVLWLNKTSNILSKYVDYFIKSDLFKSQLDVGNGATVDTLTIKKLSSIEIMVPSIEEQQRIVAKLDIIFAEIDKIINLTKEKIIKEKDLNLSALKLIFSTIKSKKKIGEIATVIAGQSPEGKYYNNNAQGLPFYQGKKEFGKHELKKPVFWTTKTTKEAYNGDVLMSVRAPVGETNMCNSKICIGRGLAAIRANKDYSPEFIYYFLKTIKNQIVGNTGAVFNSINKKQIEEIEIASPNLKTQNEMNNKIKILLSHIEEMNFNSKLKLNNLYILKSSILKQELEHKAA